MKVFNKITSASASIVLFFLLLITDAPNLAVRSRSLAKAEITQGYVPPPGRTRRARTEGAGSRGCNQANPITLKLLAPDNHVAATISAHPTFFWYVSATSSPMMFALVEQGVAKPVWQDQLQPPKAGIVQVKLPSNLSGLEVGKEYRWTVSLVCNQKRPSENTYAYAWIERVPITPKLQQKLAAVASKRELSLAYAQAGIWYDAITTIYNAGAAQTASKHDSDHLARLLNQIGLPKAASQK